VGVWTVVALASRATRADDGLPRLAVPVKGAIVAVGGGSLPDRVRARFIELGGGMNAKLVVIPSASERAGIGADDEWLAAWNPLGVSSITLLHAASREQADDAQWLKPLAEATAVWIDGGDQRRLAELYLGTAVQRELENVLSEGGVVGGTSAGAAVLCHTMIEGGNPQAEVAEGFGLVRGVVIDQHFLARDRVNRLAGVLRNHAGEFGLGIDERTAVVFEGRSIRVLGDSYAVVLLGESEIRPMKISVLKEGDAADLLALSRAAVARAGAPFPPRQMANPIVVNGTLLIVGGGGMDRAMWERFIAAAGGPEAPLVVIPTAQGDGPQDEPAEVRRLKSMGCANVSWIDARTPEAQLDEAFLKALREAKGVWFGGGRQWRFVDAYEDTQAEALFHDVLRRGGVIGGSSAGATIQGDYLVRGSPLGNQEMMAEGYERGFAFLPGTAIDQHFTQRNRIADMRALMAAFPQVVGIGIDEATAIVVSGTVAEVMGKNQVRVFDRDHAPAAAVDGSGEDHVVLNPTDRYDFATGERTPGRSSDD
jgi:cyanophycinase